MLKYTNLQNAANELREMGKAKMYAAHADGLHCTDEFFTPLADAIERRNQTALNLAEENGALKATLEQLEDDLRHIRQIIESVDNRCMAVDGPVTPTLEEMTQDEISEIYHLAGGETGD